MTKGTPRDIGTQAFASWPKALRAYALQIQCVREGVKPACLIAMNADQLGDSLAHLRSLNLSITVEQYAPGPASFAQTNPTHRAEALAKPRVRVYVAKSAADAKRLAKLEIKERDYSAAGLALGYPVCCVGAAAERDRLSFDEHYNLWRQTNLNAAAAAASDSLDYRCNFLWSESDLSGIGPLALIAHSPCHYACPDSAAVGESASRCGARAWPAWSAALLEMLRAPIFYWSDELWPPNCWDEFCGVALLYGYQEQDSIWRCPQPAVLLGAGKTPAGDLPREAVRIQITESGLFFHGASGVVTSLPFRETGHPWLMDWQRGVIRQLT